MSRSRCSTFSKNLSSCPSSLASFELVHQSAESVVSDLVSKPAGPFPIAQARNDFPVPVGPLMIMVAPFFQILTGSQLCDCTGRDAAGIAGLKFVEQSVLTYEEVAISDKT